VSQLGFLTWSSHLPSLWTSAQVLSRCSSREVIMAQMPLALEVEDVTVSFSGNLALNSAYLSVGAGSVVGSVASVRPTSTRRDYSNDESVQ